MLRVDRVVDWNYECFVSGRVVSGKQATRLLVVFGFVSNPFS
jgi:hypothetical protein